MFRSALLWASQNRALKERLPRYAFARRAVRRFMPGEQVGDALQASEHLRTLGMSTMVSRLGENITSLQEADDVTAHYLDVLRTIAGGGTDTQISIKPTQLGLDVNEEQCWVNITRLAQQARDQGNMVWIDMEGSAYTDRTIGLFTRVREDYTNIGICLQAYLHRTPDDLEKLLRVTTAIRLVKGAYREPESIAIQGRKNIDQAYLGLAARLLEEVASGREVGAPPAIATHDLDIVRRIGKMAGDLGIPADAYEVQMLYGIQKDAQAVLAREGQRMRVLICYGSAWFAWYMRRLAERPANLWFLVRSLF